MRRTLALACVLAAIAANSPAQHGGHVLLPPAKNILVIVLDDVGTDKLSFYGETPPTNPHLPCVVVPPTHVPPYASTPRLNALRENGILFTNAYANPVCSPSRACILTGRYAFRTGVGMITNEGSFKLADSEVLVSELLRNGFVNAPIEVSGLPYKCGAFGKWHLTTKTGNDSHAVDNGFHRFYGSISNVAAFDEDYLNWTKIQQNAGGSAVPSNSTTWNATVTSTDAKDWINLQTRAFFAYVCFNPPHAPCQVPPQALVTQATWDEIVCWGGSAGAIADDDDPVQLRRLYYRAMLEATDKEIENLLGNITPAKLANTMIFVIGDNGTPSQIMECPPHTPGHGKATVYEWGVRVPLIVSGPMVKSPIPAGGWTSDALVGAVDLWSTIAAITGADPDDAAPGVTIDSQSFLPVIQDPANQGTRTYAFSQYFSENGVPLPPPDQNLCFGVHNRSISDGRYKYIRKQVVKNPPTCVPPTYTQEFYRIVENREETFDFLSNNQWTPGAWAAYLAMTAEMDDVSQP